MDGPPAPPPTGFFQLVIIGVALLLALAPLAGRGLPGRWAAEVVAAIALAVVLAALPSVGWLYGRPVYPWPAVFLALVATVPGLLLAWRAGRLVVPRARPGSRYAPRWSGDPPAPSWPAPPRPGG